jgi:hypothetical protein
MKTKILFLNKNRDTALVTSEGSNYSSGGKSSGLANSVNFVVDMLTENGVECKVVGVQDNNCIDREVSQYKPTHVVIEALWVVPEKFEVLTRLHPNVKWIVRLHSEVPFIAGEGMAFDWIPKYYKHKNVIVSGNSSGICEDIRSVYGVEVVYLPNFYPIHKVEAPKKDSFFETVLKAIGLKPTRRLKQYAADPLHIGCFGAIRPLKNQLIQAVAAMRFADSLGKTVYFHINGNRVEGKGDPVIKNIRKLFEGQSKHVLVEHPWMPHAKFTELLKNMDMTLQVSFTETYNIVAADSISAGIPVVTSDEITFVPAYLHAKPTESSDIVDKMTLLYNTDLDKVLSDGYENLLADANLAKCYWLNWVKHEEV